MKQALKFLSFFIMGILLALGLLYFYADTFFNSPTPATEMMPQKIDSAKPGDAVITRISGEVFIIRNDVIHAPLPGDMVMEGDIIKVVDESFCQVRFAGTASLRIRSNTLVRIRKLLSGSKDADIRTELLTGSMIYKVKELKDSENLQILAQKRIFRVEGTEFMVEALPNGRTALSVVGGKVAVLSLNQDKTENLLKTLVKNERTILERDVSILPEIEILSGDDRDLFKAESPDDLSIQREDLVYLQISSRPAGARIYINGRLNGSNKIKGLFLPDTELTILLRKRGYKDKTFHILPGELAERNIVIDLIPAGLDQTLEEEQKQENLSAVELLKLRHQEELTELRSSFTQKLAVSSHVSESLKKSETFLTKENISLEEELTKSRNEARKLRELIKQIQELAEEEQ
ncbi:MAG: hypothetical protein B6241_01635 [Spirochaetaceae bacterium 4572_59]|nr:MAG: hypothetical protein B6241_01635 [Spirochaetaceae bacterium 4572_59]